MAAVRSLPVIDRILLVASDQETFDALSAACDEARDPEAPPITLGEDHGRSVP